MLPTAINARINSTMYKILAWLPYMEHINIHLFPLPQKVKHFSKFKGAGDDCFIFLSQRTMQLLDTGKTFCIDYYIPIFWYDNKRTSQLSQQLHQSSLFKYK